MPPFSEEVKMNNSVQKIILILLCFFYWVPELNTFFVSLVTQPVDFKVFGSTEWLINYSSGFLRRGLGGEIVSYLMCVTDWTASTVIKTLSCFGFITYLFCLLFSLKKAKISLFILMCPVFLGCLLSSAVIGFSFYRKDTVLMFLAFLSFFSSAKITKGQILYLNLFLFVNVVGTLLHEAYFFLTFPASLILLMQNIHNEDTKIKFLKYTSLVIWILVFISCVLVKGSPDVANSVWHSWDHALLLQNWSKMEPIGSISALSLETVPTILVNIKSNFLNDSGIAGIQNGFMFLLMFILVNFILLKHQYLDSEKESFQTPPKLLFTTLLIQLFSMSPLFLFLFCDYGRLMVYYFSTAIFLNGIINREKINIVFPNSFNKLIASFYHAVNNLFAILGLNSRSAYLLAFIIVAIPPVNNAGRYLTAITNDSLIGNTLGILFSIFKF